MSPTSELSGRRNPGQGGLCAIGTRRHARRIRLLALGIGALMSLLLTGFAFFVVISWGVLRDAAGLAGLLVLLGVVTATATGWCIVLVRKVAQPLVPLTRRIRLGIVVASVVATVSGVAGVPAIRAELEADKCHRIAAADTESHERCRDWLRTRREWWTFGLSHRNASGRSSRSPR